MKQHITLEQWEKLNSEQSKLLADLVVKSPCGRYLELPSIGRMIEFLEGDRPEEVRYIDNHFDRVLDFADHVSIGWNTTGDDSLCDALWEAVKNKLNHPTI